MTGKKAYLRPNKEKSVKNGHPWLFLSAIDRIEGDPENGEIISVFSSKGEFLSRGAYSHNSNIRIRNYTRIDEPIDESFYRRQLENAISFRNNLICLNDTNAFRLFHGESDGIPGLIVDRYDNTLVMQPLTAGVEREKKLISELLMELTGYRNLFERSDVDVRALEGLEQHKGWIFQQDKQSSIEIREGSIKYLVDVENGQKTGFYLDQRANRARLLDFVKGKKVLNCFCFTGGFTLSALKADCSEVWSVDISGEAITQAKANADLNGFFVPEKNWIVADVFTYLRGLRDRGESFDVIVLDPPKFAPTINQVPQAARGYKDINLLAFKLLKPGGTLFTFSCSGGVDIPLFQKIVSDAALDGHVNASIIGSMCQDSDHPIALTFPESRYLKGLICVKRN